MNILRISVLLAASVAALFAARPDRSDRITRAGHIDLSGSVSTSDGLHEFQCSVCN